MVDKHGEPVRGAPLFSHSCAKVTHSGLEVHRSPPVEQQRRDVDVPVVSGDVQRRETALATRDGEKNRSGEKPGLLLGRRETGGSAAGAQHAQKRDFALMLKRVELWFKHAHVSFALFRRPSRKKR